MHGVIPLRITMFLAVPGLLLLTACAPVGPDYTSPQLETPARWQTGGSPPGTTEAPLADWWKLFNDPQLTRLISQSLAANPDLAIAATRIREARGQRQLRVAAALPSADLGAASTGSDRSKNVASSSRNQELYQADFDAGWELDLFGSVRRQIEAADASLAATIEDQHDVRVSLCAEVARTYLEYRASRQRLNIARDTIRSQEQTVTLVRSKKDFGLGSELEIAQAETLLAQTRAQVPALEIQSAQALNQLAVLLGRQPGTLPAELAEPVAIMPVPLDLPATLPSELLRQRPDIRAAERRLARATANVGLATAELFPRFSLSALVGLQANALGDLVTGSSRFWSVGPAVRWSLFDGGRARAGIDISQAQEERAKITYEKTVLTSLAETENALVALERERAACRLLTEAVESGTRAFRLASDQYAMGLTPFLNVLQTENALFQSQDKLAQSQQRLAEAMIALYKALGGGWQHEQPLAASFPMPFPRYPA